MLRKMLLVALCVAYAGAAFTVKCAAQAPSYRPGDRICFTIRFDGEDIDKISWVSLFFDLHQAVPSDQIGLFNDFAVDETKKIEPGTYEVSGKVPWNAASGKYYLDQIGAGNKRIGLVFIYNQPGLPSITFNVDNPEVLKKPELKSLEKNP